MNTQGRVSSTFCLHFTSRVLLVTLFNLNQPVPWSQQLNNLEGQMNNSDLVAAQATSSQKLKRQLRAQLSFKNAPENPPRREGLTSAALLRFALSLLSHSFSPCFWRRCGAGQLQSGDGRAPEQLRSTCLKVLRPWVLKSTES